jgi:hypothetical protein
MKTLAIILALVASSVSAQTYVPGYFKKDGTYVQGYYKSDSNSTTQDTNPFTGERGTKQPEPIYRPLVCGNNSHGQYVCQ